MNNFTIAQDVLDTVIKGCVLVNAVIITPCHGRHMHFFFSLKSWQN